MSARVVLVRPENPTNIGAVARVARNMGLTSLDLVDPGDWRTLPCWRTAWRAHELLEQAAVFGSLGEALAGAHYCAAFSGKPGGRGAPLLDLREMAEEVGRLPEDEAVCLVFGPERSGLTEAEMALCGRRVLIPSHPQQPSLNLSHAVAVAAYEVFRARGRTQVQGPARSRATHEEKHRMLGLLREGLRAIKALPARDHEADFLQWEALFGRADLTPKEVRLLEHMARRMMGGAAMDASTETSPEARDDPEALDREVDNRTRGRLRGKFVVSAIPPPPTWGGDRGGGSMIDRGSMEEPFGDVRVTERGFSIPLLKWRELLFVGALRAQGEDFVRDAARPLPPFRAADPFPDGARLEVVSQGDGRIELRRKE